MIKRDLSGMGKWLFVGAMVLMVGAVINVFVGSTAGMLVDLGGRHRHLLGLHAL